AQHRLLVVPHVPGKAQARLPHRQIIGNLAVRRKQWVREIHAVGGLRRIDDRIGEDLAFPAQTVVERQIRQHLELVLDKERIVLVRDFGEAGRRSAAQAGAAALQVQEQRTTREGGSGGAIARTRDDGAVAATRRGRTEAAGRRRRRVAQEAGHAVEDVAAGEETAEHLAVVAVQPLAAELDVVLAGEDGVVVTDLRAPEQLINRGLQEERRSETERGGESHRGVSRNIRIDRGAAAVFARVAEVPFVDLRLGDGGEQVEVEAVDERRRAFDAVGRVAVGRNVEGLVLVARTVEVVRRAHLVVLSHVPVVLGEHSRVANLVVDRLALVLIAGGFEEVEQRDALAFGVAVNQRLVGRDRRRRHGTRSQRRAQVVAPQVFEDLLDRGEAEHFVLHNGPADGAAELLAAEVLERLAIRRV